MSTLSAVILAAGASRRLGYSKLSLKINGEAVIRRTVRIFIEAHITEITVVTGFEKERIMEELSGFPVTFAHNPHHESGMSGSVRAAFPLVQGSDLVFFHLADKPFVTTDLIRRVVGAQRTGDKGIVVPVCGGVKGHPVLIDMTKYRSAVGTVEGEGGLRDLISQHTADVLFLESDEGSILDLDTEDDLMFLRRRGYTIEKD